MMTLFCLSAYPSPLSIHQQDVHSCLQAQEKKSQIPQHAHPRVPFVYITSQHLSHHTHHPVHFLGQFLFIITCCPVQVSSLPSPIALHPVPFIIRTEFAQHLICQSAIIKESEMSLYPSALINSLVPVLSYRQS